MRNLFVVCVALIVGVATLAAVRVETAQAMPPFKKAFDAKYVKPDSADDKEKAFAAEAKKVNCNVCHKGKSKKMRNAYGEAVDKFIEKNEKDPAKIEEALTKAAQEKSKPDDAASPTFGELIEQGQLPFPAGSAQEEADVE
ncbi:MAG: hypothetical protein JNG90_07155 [Planctomycetaceae bacterium]|nr:hypothetical protein [Planctomycetaceae bacterium]